MRLISAASGVFILALSFVMSGFDQTTVAHQDSGQAIFRYDTFGDEQLGTPVLDDAFKAELRTWGPGKYDPRHHAFDGTNLIPLNSPSLPIVIPSIYGLKGVGFETFSGDGPISYWNSYLMSGKWAVREASAIHASA